MSSLGRTRPIVYPALGLLALGTLAARGHWFGAASAAGADPTRVLLGETAQQQPIAVTVDDRGNIMSLQTHLTGVCSNGQSYPVSWAPNSPRIPFVHTPAGIVAQEVSSSRLSGGVLAKFTASTIAHVQGQAADGDMYYVGVFHYRRGRVQRCGSGSIHWSAAASGVRPGGSSEASRFSLGAWAGYTWEGRVGSIAASWKVPRILPGSPTGTAATWIGAQGRRLAPVSSFAEAPAPFGAWRRARWAVMVPFIQVGLNEVRVAALNGRAYDSDFAFWTDPLHGNLPIQLFDVRPGDVIAARLTLSRKRWQVSIADLSSGTSRVFWTREEAGNSFPYAEWVQENPSSPPFGTDGYLYPHLSPVRFQSLEVNSLAPAQSDLDRQWMSGDGGYFAPTAIRGDAFTVQPVSLSPAGVRYLSDVTEVNSAFASLGGVSDLTAVRATSARSRDRASRVLASAARALRNGHWPGSTQALLTRQVALLARLAKDTETPGTAEGMGSTQLGWRWLADALATVRNSRAIRAALGLPALSYPPR